MKFLRIPAQLAYALLIACYFFYFYWRDGNPKALLWLLFPGVWIAGGILALRKRKAGEIILQAAAGLLLLIGTLFHILRIAFIIKYGGMDRPGGGSPLAFLLGWAFTTIFFFAPGLYFVLWNFLALRRGKKPDTVCPTSTQGDPY